MKKGFKWNRKGVSPVIATIIIVAIAIVMSIAVAYWMLGLGASFTRYEKLEFVSCYATSASATSWDINMKVKNTGSAAATVNLVFFNGKPNDDPSLGITLPAALTTTLNPGDSTPTVTITITTAQGFSSGLSLEMTLQTTQGRQYPKVVVLP